MKEQYVLPSLVEPDRTWADDATCKGMPVQTFFPEERRPAVPSARAACDACDVDLECAIYALKNAIREGIWGGLNVRQRTKIGLAELLRRKDERDAQRLQQLLQDAS